MRSTPRKEQPMNTSTTAYLAARDQLIALSGRYDDALDINEFGGGFRLNDDQGNPNLKPRNLNPGT